MKKKHKSIIGAAVVLGATLTAASFDNKIDKSDGCGGTERWAVKIMRDYYSDSVNVDNPIDTPIASLNMIQTFNARKVKVRQPLERKVYEVICTISEKLNEGDSDYHLVIYDGSAHMIAEIPDPDCPRAKKSNFNSNFRKARNFIDNIHGDFAGKKFKIIGVAFVDFNHKQTGRAVNNLELHPVLSIEQIN